MRQLVLLLFITLLSACGGSLPTLDSVGSDTGILAIAKSGVSEVSWSPGWAREVEIVNENGNPAVDDVRLHAVNGRQIIYVKDLQPGLYQIKRMRWVPVSQNAVGNGKSDYYDLPYILNVQVKAGTVSFTEIVFHQERVRTGTNQSQTHFRPKLLAGSEYEAFKVLFEKSKNAEFWDVSWPN